MNVLAIYRRYHVVTKIGGLVSGAAIFGMMLFISADVLLRNVVGSSIPGSFEIAQNYFMPLAVFPALAWVYSSGIMPRMDLLIGRFSERLGNSLIHTLVALEIMVAAFLLWASLGYALDGFARKVSFTAGGDLLPLWPAQFLAPLGLLLLLIEVAFVMARNIQIRRPSLLVSNE